MKYANAGGLISTAELFKGIFIGLLHRIGIAGTEKIIRNRAGTYRGIS